jgi:hypothetical protein
MIHIFMHLGSMAPQANQAFDEVVHALRIEFDRKDNEGINP